MKMCINVIIGLLLVVLVQNMWVHTVNGEPGEDAPSSFSKAESMVDGEELKSIQRDLDAIDIRMDELDKRIRAHFDLMMNEVLAGKFKEENYLSALREPVRETLDFSTNVSLVSFRESAQSINDKWSGNKEYGELEISSAEIIKTIAVMEQKIEGLNDYLDEETGKVSLGLEIFEPCAEEIFTGITSSPNLLNDQVNIMENKFEYFLTGFASKEWPKIENLRKSKKAWGWPYKKVIRKSLMMIRDKETFNVEKVLKEAEKKYPEKEPIRLLYAHILLINWHDTDSLKAGYEYLNKAYENLETEALAYNLIRVALRLDKFSEHKGKLLKILDHANHNGKDKDTLGDLNDLLIYAYLRESSFDDAGKHIQSLREDGRRLSRYVSPVFKFLIYLKQGSFETIATDVAPYDPAGLAKGLYDGASKERVK